MCTGDTKGEKVLCKNCPYFHIRLEYKNKYEWGLAECTKHNLVTDFRSKKKFETLSCVESERTQDGI
jgi:hypothetical protein